MIVFQLSILLLIQLAYHTTSGQGLSYVLSQNNTVITFNQIAGIQSAISPYDPGSFEALFSSTRNIVYGISDLTGVYGILNQFLCGLVPNSTATPFSIEDVQSQLQESVAPWLGGIIALTLIGCICGVCSIVTCLIVCCCRFASYCGKEKYQNIRPVTGLICLLLWVILNLIAIVGIVIGIIIAIVSLTYASTAATSTASIPNVVPEAITGYTSELVGQVNELTYQIGDLQGLYQNELTNFNTDFVSDILSLLRQNVTAITQNLISIDSNVNIIASNLNSAEMQGTLVNETITNINSNLTNIQSTAANASAQCNAVAGLLTSISCAAIASTTNISLELKPQAIPGIDQIRSSIQSVQNQNLTGLAIMIDDTFNGLQSTIETELNNSLNNASVSINQNFNVSTILSDINIEQQIQQLTNQLNVTNLIPVSAQPVFDSLDQGISIAYYVIAAIFIIIISIQIFFSALGLLLGVLGCNLSKLPSQRTSVSNVGGNLSALAGYIGLCMLFPLFIITAIIFFLGAAFTTVCYPLADGTFFTATIDQKDSCGAGTGYILGQIAFQNSSIPLTVSGFLNACENNNGIFEAAQLQNLINISSVIGQARSSLETVANSINQTVRNGISSTIPEILTPAQNMQITDAQNQITSINIAQLNSLDTNFILDFNLNMRINDIRNLQMDLTSQATMIMQQNNASVLMFNDTLTTLINQLDGFNNLQSQNYVPTLNAISLEVNGIVTNTTFVISEIQNSITAIVNNINSIQATLNNTVPDIIFNRINVDLERLIGYASTFLTHGENSIMNNFGNCQTLSDTYNFLIDSTCRSLLDSINGFWAAMGWTCIFILLTSISSFVLARYTQKRSYEFGFDDPESDDFSKGPNYPKTEQITMTSSTNEPSYPPLPPSYSTSEGQVYQNVAL